MRIIEKFLMPKSDDESRCEDGMVFSGDFAAVVDGATSKSSLMFGSSTPGRIAMELVCDAIRGLVPDVSAQDAVACIDQRIHDWYQQRGVAEEMRANVVQRCSAVAAIYSNRRRELWLLGDCQAMIDGKLIEHQKSVESLLADLRALHIHTELARGVSEAELLLNDTGRESILPFLERQSQLQNSAYNCEFSYYVLDGFLARTDKVITVPVPDDASELVLATDGYPELYPTLQRSEQSLARLIAQDPLCFREFRSTKGVYPGNVSFDDRCYLRLALHAPVARRIICW